jgi:hypothetical protein
LKAFISYSTKDKKHGAAVKAALEKFQIKSFLAHNDLRVSEEWKNRILQELEECDIFIPLLSKEFSKSKWCDQETGISVNRGAVLIIPLSLDGTVPYGFISHIQSHKIAETGIDAEILLDAIGTKFPAAAIDALLGQVRRDANSFRAAEAVIEPLAPYFDRFSKNQARDFAEIATKNGQIWDASLCYSDYLPKFLATNRANLTGRAYKALKYQIEKHKWFPTGTP